MYNVRLLEIGTMNPPVYNEYILIKMEKRNKGSKPWFGVLKFCAIPRRVKRREYRGLICSCSDL
jgi:hypothetical protein